MSLKHQFVFIPNNRYSDTIYEEMKYDNGGFNPVKSKIDLFFEIDDFLLRYFNPQFSQRIMYVG
jgi:hypothetical protein